MNRYLKEQKKQHQEAREGLTQEQVQSLDTKDAEEKLIQLLARTWHIARFSEEYDLGNFPTTIYKNKTTKIEIDLSEFNP